MARLQGRIVINPKVLTDNRDALAIAYNEAYRMVMEANNFEPMAEPTEEQLQFFADTAYANDPLQLKRTITARIATYDDSVPNPTPEQYQDVVNMLEMVQQAGVIQNQEEEDVVSSTLEDMTEKAGQLEQLQPAEQGTMEEGTVPAEGALPPESAMPPEGSMPEGATPSEDTMPAEGGAPQGLDPAMLQQMMGSNEQLMAQAADRGGSVLDALVESDEDVKATTGSLDTAKGLLEKGADKINRQARKIKAYEQGQVTPAVKGAFSKTDKAITDVENKIMWFKAQMAANKQDQAVQDAEYADLEQQVNNTEAWSGARRDKLNEMEARRKQDEADTKALDEESAAAKAAYEDGLRYAANKEERDAVREQYKADLAAIQQRRKDLAAERQDRRNNDREALDAIDQGYGKTGVVNTRVNDIKVPDTTAGQTGRTEPITDKETLRKEGEARADKYVKGVQEKYKGGTPTTTGTPTGQYRNMSKEELLARAEEQRQQNIAARNKTRTDAANTQLSALKKQWDELDAKKQAMILEGENTDAIEARMAELEGRRDAIKGRTQFRNDLHKNIRNMAVKAAGGDFSILDYASPALKNTMSLATVDRINSIMNGSNNTSLRNASNPYYRNLQRIAAKYGNANMTASGDWVRQVKGEDQWS